MSINEWRANVKRRIQKNKHKSSEIALGIGQNCVLGVLIEGVVSFQSVDLIVSGFLLFFSIHGAT